MSFAALPRLRCPSLRKRCRIAAVLRADRRCTFRSPRSRAPARLHVRASRGVAAPALGVARPAGCTLKSVDGVLTSTGAEVERRSAEWQKAPSASAVARNASARRVLPIPGRRKSRRRNRIRRGYGLRQQFGKASALPVAAHERPSRGALFTQAAQLPHADVTFESADGHGVDRFDVGQRADGATHVVRYRSLACVRQLGEARGQIHRRRRSPCTCDAPRFRCGSDDLAARDADMCGERPRELAGERRHGGVNVDGGAERALDVVAMRDRRAENAHHRVAEMLVDRAAHTARSRCRRVSK